MLQIKTIVVVVRIVSICVTTILVECSVDLESESAPLKSYDSWRDQYLSNPYMRGLRKGPVIIGIVPSVAYKYAPLSDAPFYYPPDKPNSKDLYNPFLRSTVFTPVKRVIMNNYRSLNSRPRLLSFVRRRSGWWDSPVRCSNHLCSATVIALTFII